MQHSFQWSVAECARSSSKLSFFTILCKGPKLKATRRRCAAEKRSRASLRFGEIPNADQAADCGEEALSSFTRSLFTKLLFNFTRPRRNNIANQRRVKRIDPFNLHFGQ